MSPTITGPLPGEFRWSCTLAASRPHGPRLSDLLVEVVETVAAAGGGPTQLWLQEVVDDDHARAEAAGFVAYRDLLQMRCPLPTAATDVAVRAYTDDDAEAFLAVNNRAFHWHPEQGGMTVADLHARQAEPWYDPAGFLLHDAGGRLAGFCWTKIHCDHDPPLGEIYAIAVDPDFHGQGLGRALTLAGLQWLVGRGLEVGMLYVEADNEPALRTYGSIGFTTHHTDRAYRRTIEGV